MKRAFLAWIIVLFACHLLGDSIENTPLNLIQSVDLPNYSGDFDHFAVDLEKGRLFLAAEDHGTVEVFDLKSGKRIKSVSGFEAPHSFLYMPAANKLLVTDSGKGLSKILDADDFKVVKTLRITPGADSIGFDRSARQLYIVTGGKDAHL